LFEFFRGLGGLEVSRPRVTQRPQRLSGDPLIFARVLPGEKSPGLSIFEPGHRGAASQSRAGGVKFVEMIIGIQLTIRITKNEDWTLHLLRELVFSELHGTPRSTQPDHRIT
jgi:hypothetical protein